MYMRVRTVLWLTVAALLFACGEPADPVGPSIQRRAAGAADETIEITSLRRLSALPRDLATFAVIGPEGGSIRLGDAGLTLTIPQGALRRRTLIEVRARAGHFAVYEFQPHGLVFSVPALLEQDLVGTVAWRNQRMLRRLEGAYLPSGMLDSDVDGVGSASELLLVRLDGSAARASFAIQHFSGYTMASGRVATRESTQ